MISIDSTEAVTAPTTPLPQTGTRSTREYSPLTTLADRHGREWTVTSYGTSAWLQGVMPQFEALAIWRLEQLHGPIVVKRASLTHQRLRHPYGLPGCPNCPPMTCHCGDAECTDYETCRHREAGADGYWRRAVAA